MIFIPRTTFSMNRSLYPLVALTIGVVRIPESVKFISLFMLRFLSIFKKETLDIHRISTTMVFTIVFFFFILFSLLFTTIYFQILFEKDFSFPLDPAHITRWVGLGRPCLRGYVVTGNVTLQQLFIE